jgi:hypothetical protein
MKKILVPTDFFDVDKQYAKYDISKEDYEEQKRTLNSKN